MIDEGMMQRTYCNYEHEKVIGLIDSSGIITKPEDEVDLGDTARKVNGRKGSPEERSFAIIRRAELEGLIHNGTFLRVPEDEIKDGPRIFRFRFVDEL